MGNNLCIEMVTSKCGRYMNVRYFSGKEELIHFDIKQMICHLLGIAAGILKGTLKKKQMDFIYLLYDPTHLEILLDVKSKIDEIYQRTCYECKRIDFSALLRVILSFLRKEKLPDSIADDDIEKMIGNFHFMLISQDGYPRLLG